MADSIRERIIKNLEETILASPLIAYCKYGSFELSKVSKPAVGILPDEELTDEEPDDNLIEKLRLSLRLAASNQGELAGYELEHLNVDVHQRIFVDPTRGGIADDTKKVGVKWGYLDPHYPHAGLDLNIEIQYQTEKKDPTEQSGIGPGVS